MAWLLLFVVLSVPYVVGLLVAVLEPPWRRRAAAVAWLVLIALGSAGMLSVLFVLAFAT